MAGLGNLTVDLRTNSAKFNQGMDSARGNLKGFKSSVISVKGAVVALAGAGGLGLLVKSSLDSVDALAKTSDKLGIATEKLAGLRHAAELTGVSSNTMDMALQRMTRRLAEAAQGGGEAKAAIEQLGLDAQKLASQSPDKSFREIAAAMEGVDQQSEKVRLAFKFFDSEGVALVNTLSLGSKGLNEASKEAEQLGIAITRIDAAKIEAANDSMTRAKAVFKGAGQALTVELAPFIEATANQFVGLAKDAGGFGEIAKDAVNIMASGLGKVADLAHGVQIAWKGLEVIVLGFGAAATLTINQVVDGWRQIGNLIPGIDVAPIQLMQDMTDSYATALMNARSELSALYDQELPSARVIEIADTVIDKAQQMATEVAKTKEAMGGLSTVAANDSDGLNNDDTQGIGVLGLTDEQMETELDLASKQFSDLEKLEKQSAKRRIQIEKQVSSDIIAMKMSVVSQAANLLNMLAGDSKNAAIAVIAVEKGLAIAQTVMNTQVAAMRAIAELGPVAGPVAAGKIKTLGAISIGLITGTGLAQAANVGGGGGSVSPGSVPQSNLDPVPSIDSQTSDQTSGGSVQIIINGAVTEDMVRDVIVPVIQDDIRDRDLVLIDGESRQAGELVA